MFTDQSTNSTSFTDLATVGPAVTVTIGANGCALVLISCGLYGTNTANKYVTVQLSGANTISALTNAELGLRSTAQAFSMNSGRAMFFSGLTPGSTTFTMKYMTQSGTGNFFSRRITVIPL